MKPGYLQIKISDLESKLIQSENKVIILYNKIKNREEQLNKIFQETKNIIEEHNKIIKYEKENNTKLLEKMNIISEYFEKKEKILFKKIKNIEKFEKNTKEIQRQDIQIQNQITKNIISFDVDLKYITKQLLLLLTILFNKNILDNKDLQKIIDQN